jgi:hypothetical protein
MLWTICSLAIFSQWVHADPDPNNYFIEPGPSGTSNDFSENNEYVVGTELLVKWATNFTEMSLTIYQNDNASFQYLPNMSETKIIEVDRNGTDVV